MTFRPKSVSLPNTLLLRDLYGRVDQGTLNMNGDFDLDERMKTQGLSSHTQWPKTSRFPQLLKFFPATLHERLRSMGHAGAR